MNWEYKPLYNPVVNGAVPAFKRGRWFVVKHVISGAWRVRNPAGVLYERNFRTAKNAMSYADRLIKTKGVE